MRRFFRWLKHFFRRKPVQPAPVKPVPTPINPAPVTGGPVEYTKITKNDIKKRTHNYYRALYATMQITNIGAVEYTVNKIKKHQDKYKKAEKLTGIDWRIIATIHQLEAGGNFDRQILNGERYWKRTRLVPRGEGPWSSWEESCIDAFKYHRIESNEIGAVLKFLERYNGLGYIRHGINSPYIWSFTNHYTKGKYVADGKYSSSAVSKQVGAAPILKMLGF